MTDGKWFLKALGISAAVFALTYVAFRFLFNEPLDSALRGAASGAIGGLVASYWLRKHNGGRTQG